MTTTRKNQNKPQPPRFRPSFTLVELLIAISIIGIMSGMILFAMLGAQNDARVARTRGTIQKLNDIVLQQWEEYRYKSVDVRIPTFAKTPIPGSNPPRYPVSPREIARLRMLVLRDTMRMEMPDRITDLLYYPSEYTVAYRDINNNPVANKLERALPTRFGLLYESLRSTINSLRSQGFTQWDGLTLEDPIPVTFAGESGVGRFSPQNDALWQNAVQSSELLYLLVSSSQYAGSSALEFFRASEVGDTDEDGLLEFIDAWGKPISWIRWPAGYPGDLVRYADDDAMDPLKTDWRYRQGVAAEWHPKTLVPLILSAGADEEFGVTFDFFIEGTTPPIAYATMEWPQINPSPPFGTPDGSHYLNGPYYYPDPFFTENDDMPDGTNQIGSIPTPVAAEFAIDNITNHDIILEP